MKATEQCFLVELLIMFYNVVLTFESGDEILYSVTIQMKATEQYFLVELLIMLYNVVLTFESGDEILKLEHSQESYVKYFPNMLYVLLFYEPKCPFSLAPCIHNSKENMFAEHSPKTCVPLDTTL